MHRTQLLIEPWQYEALKARAEQSGRSVSDVVRGILNLHLAAPVSGAADPLLAIDGLFSDPEHGGEDHDDLLYGTLAR